MKKLLQYIPLTILLLISILSIFLAAMDYAVLHNTHYFGFALVLASLIAVLINAKLGRIVTLITLFLGTLNLVRFNTNYYITESFIFENQTFSFYVEFQIQIFSFCLLVIFLIINRKAVGRVLLEIFRVKDTPT
ncbi:hypothetical protein SAMN05518672_104322 [Chitinophaga sp. CF118]|nr:hypothetical protein SAMN05518672_104322 [Chitinophaga sp. CF118]